MPEFRQDPVIGRWVIISVERARRPGNFIDPVNRRRRDDDQECDLCVKPDNPVYTLGDICVVRSRQSSSTPGQQTSSGQNGLYEVIKDAGIHETVIEMPEHVSNMADLSVGRISKIVQTYVARFDEIEQNTRLTHALIYKNYGLSQFAHHACSHIMAMPVASLEITEKLSGARQYFKDHKRCVYCDLVEREIRDKKRIVVETDDFLAVIPFAARFLFEIWIIPRKHHADFAQGIRGHEEDLAKILKIVLQKIKNGLDDTAYSWVIQTAPFRRQDASSPRPEVPRGEGAFGQRPGGSLREEPVGARGKWRTIDVDYHWHMELIPRLTRMAGFEKGSGFYICAIPPEEMAEYLRDKEI
ncbi:MAG: hypothetical protein HZC18_00060 [Candidatus Omnitrophica bacterium]|nr:hypothetical protein [Candidatus Omnitrophota bacterium]